MSKASSRHSSPFNPLAVNGRVMAIFEHSSSKIECARAPEFLALRAKGEVHLIEEVGRKAKKAIFLAQKI